MNHKTVLCFDRSRLGSQGPTAAWKGSLVTPRMKARDVTGSSALFSTQKIPRTSQDLQDVAIGNGGGKQGRGNQPYYRRYGPDTEILYRLRKLHRHAKPSRSLRSPYGISVSTPHHRYGQDCGRRFCRRRL